MIFTVPGATPVIVHIPVLVEKVTVATSVLVLVQLSVAVPPVPTSSVSVAVLHIGFVPVMVHCANESAGLMKSDNINKIANKIIFFLMCVFLKIMMNKCFFTIALS
jgi:hypothetical protein